MNKKILVIIIAFLIFASACVSVFAFMEDPELKYPAYDPDSIPIKFKNEAGYIWATIATVVQIAAVACVVFAGLRYMFASADQKADIKQGMIYLAIGAVLVFGAVSIVRLVAITGREIMFPALVRDDMNPYR